MTDLVNKDSVAIGKKAPDFEAFDRNGARFHTGTLQGKYVLIDFWSEALAPSLAEIPYWERAKRRFAGKKITFVRVAVGGDEAAWIRYFDQHQLQGVQLHANPYKAPLSYYLLKPNNRKGKTVLSYRLPRYCLIDPKGIILDNDVQVKTTDSTAFDRFLETLPGI